MAKVTRLFTKTIQFSLTPILLTRLGSLASSESQTRSEYLRGLIQDAWSARSDGPSGVNAKGPERASR
jgi:predicted DNA-binding protein